MTTFQLRESQQIERDGFFLTHSLVSSAECAELISILGQANGPGRRDVLAIPEIRGFALSGKVLAIVSPNVFGAPKLVRGIYFDKGPEANWLVPWHQDLTIAVRQQKEVSGYGPWSSKEGVAHVQPPAEVLEGMITVRIHLDPADATNGALRVLPGTHRHGRLSAKGIAELRQTTSEVLCCAAAGDTLLMRPLLLHASGKSRTQSHRRIIHLEYAGIELPGGLEWLS